REYTEANAMNTALYPGTIGYFLEVLMRPVIPDSALPHLREFFSNYVTARGALPAIRVGDQPYGMLLTSNIGQWADINSFYNGLGNVLKRLQSKWDALAATKAIHVGMSGDPNEILLQVLAQQAGSVAFAQRLGHMIDFSYVVKNIDSNDLRNQMLVQQEAIYKLLQELGYNPQRANDIFPWAASLHFYGNERLKTIQPIKLIDGRTPSEMRFLEKIEAIEANYIEWLSTVKSIDDLESHNMKGVTPPRYLLYLLLRHGLLQMLQNKVETFYKNKNILAWRGAFAKSLFNFKPDIPDLTSWELLRGKPSEINPNIFTIQQPLGNYFLNLPSESEEAAGIAEIRSALQELSKLSTGRLARYLSEHLDLCTYRLDAWQSGLFGRRLQQKRMQHPNGLYVGAFGWLENLKRAALNDVTSSVPDKLKPQNGTPVYRQSDNAGFVHTPSLNHATATGLLLAGYQNHADSAQPETFAINLSSERIRRAMFVYEGIKNGQSIEALLGYQFERGLHDLTSASAANLNQYILAFREKFPIETHVIPQRGSADVQESITAYAVVNGLKLMDASDALVSSIVPNAGHFNLIKDQIKKLADTLDATSDMLMAESAYQVTQGNFERTAAVLNAIKKAELPTDVQVIDTPRTSYLSFINRVSIHYPINVPIRAGLGWSAAIAARALMEPGLNQWLGAVIGNPMNIFCKVVSLNENQLESKEALIKLSDLSIHPIDLIYLVGPDLNAGLPELESRIAKFYRTQNRIERAAAVKIYFNPPLTNPDHKTFAQVIPLLRHLRLLVTTARPANAKDFQSSAKPNANSNATNIQADRQYGWDVTDLRRRVIDVLDKMEIDFEEFVREAPNNILPKSEENPQNFRQLFERYTERGNDDTLFSVLELDADAIWRINKFLEEASLYGIQLAFPDYMAVFTTIRKIDLLRKAATTWKTMKEKIASTKAKLSQADAETDHSQKINILIEAAKQVVGEEYRVIPRFKYSNPEEISKTLQDKGNELLSYIRNIQKTDNKLAVEAWLQSLARVRPEMDRMERVRMIGEALDGMEISFQAAQIPHRSHDSWLSVEFPETYAPNGTPEPFQISDETIALAIHGTQAVRTNDLQSALIVDEWTESIPNKNEITGIAFNYDQPNSSPPNALLLAVEPTGSAHWDWDVVLGILKDTLQRAKTRAVEPDHIAQDSVLRYLLPMTVASFDFHDANISMDYMVVDDSFINSVSPQHELYKIWLGD
ncbi:MAG: hypothetical protein SFU99_19880, partial [Saprospiraceae bacterium]|nr:hypothetical protein [Saprospiraceae bacterium]